MNKSEDKKFRIEHDSMGEVRVPAEHYWGAQTERSRQNFKLGDRKMPAPFITSYAILKGACASSNHALGKLDGLRSDLINSVCDEIREGKLTGEFPLSIYQTGSGTQTNMNLNEVIANRGNEIHGSDLLKPNDHVNMSQSSNDTFPTVMHISAIVEIRKKLMPALDRIIDEIRHLEDKNKGIIKSGRTHLQDAVPLFISQEFSGWRAMLEHDREFIKESSDSLRELAIGGTAVGTGLNSPDRFDEEVCDILSKKLNIKFYPSENKFYQLTSKNALAFSHGAVKALAADLIKIANDVRLMSSGPRLGFAEITIPSNEPGSSIMPGKVNPTQAEALIMASLRVMGNDVVVGTASSQGILELNVCMPVIMDAYMESIRIISESIDSFTKNCLNGLSVNTEKLNSDISRSLMLVTALSPSIGYEKAAEIAIKAHREGRSLRDVAMESGYVSEEDFDTLTDPIKMLK